MFTYLFWFKWIFSNSGSSWYLDQFLGELLCGFRKGHFKSDVKSSWFLSVLQIERLQFAFWNKRLSLTCNILNWRIRRLYRFVWHCWEYGRDLKDFFFSLNLGQLLHPACPVGLAAAWHGQVIRKSKHHLFSPWGFSQREPLQQNCLSILVPL